MLNKQFIQGLLFGGLRIKLPATVDEKFKACLKDETQFWSGEFNDNGFLPPVGITRNNFN